MTKLGHKLANNTGAEIVNKNENNTLSIRWRVYRTMKITGHFKYYPTCCFHRWKT